ncbi:MAG TPA: hypothetical protein VGD91_07350 [Trebonia sp.]
MNVALPVIGQSYRGSDLSGLSWVLNAYAIIFAALLVPAGRVALQRDRSGLAISPGPATAAVFAVSAGRIRARFGRIVPAMAGTFLMAVAAGYWMLFTGPQPD